jgi:hypothetical protein
MAMVPLLKQRYHEYLETPPPFGSRAAELADDALGERALHIASTSLASALDHVGMMGRIFASRELPPYALFGLARTALEGALTAEWLMEPGLSLSDQIARGVGAQCDDYDQRAKLETAIGLQPTGKTKRAVDRKAAYMSKALDRHHAKLNEDGALVPTRPLLAVVALFDRFEEWTVTRAGGSEIRVPGSALYRVLSAFAHSKQWANMLSEMTPAVERDGNGHTIVSIVASDDVLRHAFVRPVDAIRRALDGVGSHRHE